MDIIITNEPEALIVPDGLEEAVKLAAEKVAELYGMKNAAAQREREMRFRARTRN